MNYLVVRFSTLGSIAMLVPILESLSRKYPDNQYVVVGQKQVKPLFSTMPNVIFEQTETDQLSFVETYRLFKKLSKSFHIDVVVDLQDSLSSRELRSLFFVRGIRVSVIKKFRSLRRKLLERGYSNFKPLPSEFELYCNTFRAVGLETDFEFSSLPSDNFDVEYINRYFGPKPAKEQWLGFAPFAKHNTNMLPFRESKRLLMYLCSRPNTRVFLFGAGELECEVLEQWESVSQNATSVSGKMSLGCELELMRRLDMMICMDSANQHLSSLVQLPTLSIWCGTHPYAGFYGWKQRTDFILQKDLDCRPCTLHGADKCSKGTFECQQFAANEIIEKVEWCIKQLETN